MTEVLRKLDFATHKTLEVHPEFDFEASLMGYVQEDFNPVFFTSKGGARDLIRTITPDEFISEMIRFAYEIGMLYERISADAPEYKEFIESANQCYSFYSRFFHESKDPMIYLKANLSVLINIARQFGKFRYHNYAKYNLLLKKFNIECEYNYLTDYKHSDEVIDVKNLRPRHRVINQCREDVLNNRQMTLASAEYDVDGRVFAITDVGLKRKNQEDGVLITSHPQNSEYRLMAVADGMGGLEYGEKASNETLAFLCRWFENLDIDDLNDPSDLNPMFASAIEQISADIYKKYNGKAGTTLSCIITCKGVTFVASIGDSRVYMMKNSELSQIFQDDSYVQMLFNQKKIKTKDDMRFHVDNNQITSGIGIYPKMKLIHMKFITNYDLLLLFTDGVTDCLSDEKIKLFASKKNVSEIAKDIVLTAKYSISERINREDDEEEYFEKVVGGKDNLTAVVYDPGRGR